MIKTNPYSIDTPCPAYHKNCKATWMWFYNARVTLEKTIVQMRCSSAVVLKCAGWSSTTATAAVAMALRPHRWVRMTGPIVTVLLIG